MSVAGGSNGASGVTSGVAVRAYKTKTQKQSNMSWAYACLTNKPLLPDCKVNLPFVYAGSWGDADLNDLCNQEWIKFHEERASYHDAMVEFHYEGILFHDAWSQYNEADFWCVVELY